GGVGGGGEPEEQQVEKTLYGDTPGILSDPEQSNHRGQPYQVYDNAGVVTSDFFDFKGNLLSSSRQLRSDYKATADWQQDMALEEEIFSSSTKYDALNRPVQLVAPHSNQGEIKFDIIRPGYNEANLLERVDVWPQQSAEPDRLLDPETAGLHAVTNIDYDAKGQRERIEYGNGAITRYAYDEETYRLIQLLTTRPPGGNGLAANIFSNPDTIQDLHYTYDPAGNITRIEDRALQTIHHSGEVVQPAARYTYDALYRLIEAEGREHIGQCAIPATKDNTRDFPFAGYNAHANDSQAMRNYTERYIYDEVGNFENFIHRATGGNWQRDYQYEEASLLAGEAGVSNRLSSTILHPNGDAPETALYN
ncbi:MAG: toxin, partial [Candidatus Electrothrix sp. AR3]|nr:toxin [Candidatus Electrothrix sp. AR3]